MAYEIFDDIAFFYLSTALTAIILFPWSIYKYTAYKSRKSPAAASSPLNSSTHDSNCSCSVCKLKLNSLPSKSSSSTYLSIGNILFVLSWLFFVSLLLQIPSYNQSKLVSFEPYTILGLDSSQQYSDAELKNIYRKLSKLYHPDKVPVDKKEEANERFILIQKAYSTLTDPAAKENIEKYGNPDGYQGVSYTIGLPSWLTKKENEMRVLVLYFLIFLVIPPIAVFIWW
jgi:translocation protein SEC63